MPQMSSSGADFDGVAASMGAIADPLMEAAVFLIQQEAFGVIWLGSDLVVQSSTGALAGDAIVGAHVTRSLLPLIGLEEDLLALRMQASSEPLRLASVAVVSGVETAARRLNINVFWSASRQKYLVLLGTMFVQGSPVSDLDQEIRRRRLIEQDLAAKTQEYARINEQLGQFAYVISHDLNAPLRALRYLSRDIQDAVGASQAGGALDLDQLDKSAGDIAAQTRRVSRMLADLLDYARIGQVRDAIEPVATRAMAAEIIATLKPTTRLRLSMTGAWPEIDTVRAPLDLVLRNLVENAVKHHDRSEGHIVIGAEQRGRHVVFTIADDGRGITAEWQKAIFEPFRKVDDAHHPESSGIGLALVKKTVTTLGGRIDVHSDAPTARGTTFTVLWPLRVVDGGGAAA